MVINYLAETLVPFSVVENPSFRALMGKNILLKTRMAYSRDLLPMAYEGVKHKIIEMITDAQSISATTDFCSNFKGTLMRFAVFWSCNKLFWNFLVSHCIF
jgi:hypothetical protein